MADDYAQQSLARLHKLLAGRQPYPWGRSVGIARGTIGRMLTGAWPNPEALVQMCRMESVSLSWLVAGEGAPYTIERCADPDFCIQLFQQTEQIVHVILLRSPKGMGLLIGDRDLSEKADYSWIRWTLCVGEALSGEAAAAIHASMRSDNLQTRYLELSRAKFTQLLRAEVGTFTLLGSDDTPAHDAWLDDADPCTPGDIAGMLAHSPHVIHYQADLQSTRNTIRDEPYGQTEVDRLFQRCTTAQQLAVIEVLRGLSQR